MNAQLSPEEIKAAEAAAKISPATPEFGLKIQRPSEAGKSLGLRPGDQIVAINGVRFTGTIDLLRKRFSARRGVVCALTFQRGGKAEFDVLTPTPELGVWQAAEPAPKTERNRLYPQVMTNWEIFRGEDGVYDLQPLRAPLMALIAPPLWLAQARLWMPLGLLLASVILSLPAGPIMAGIVYALGSIYVWRAATAMFRADRMSHGLRPFAVVAAVNERGAHKACRQLHPTMRFAYDRSDDQDEEEMAVQV